MLGTFSTGNEVAMLHGVVFYILLVIYSEV